MHELIADAPGQKAYAAGTPALAARQQDLDGVEVALLRLNVVEDHRSAGKSQLFERVLAGGAVGIAFAHPQYTGYDLAHVASFLVFAARAYRGDTDLLLREICDGITFIIYPEGVSRMNSDDIR